MKSFGRQTLNPRKGTETSQLRLPEDCSLSRQTLNPRKGTETDRISSLEKQKAGRVARL